MKRTHAKKLMEQLKVILEEAEITHVDDPALPGCVIPCEKGEDRLGIYAAIPFDGGIVVKTAIPVDLEDGNFLYVMALCNEVNRRIPFGTTFFCPDKSLVEVRLGRAIFGSLLSCEVLNQIGMVRDLSFSLFDPLRLLAAGETEVTRLLQVWEEAVSALSSADEEEFVDPAG